MEKVRGFEIAKGFEDYPFLKSVRNLEIKIKYNY